MSVTHYYGAKQDSYDSRDLRRQYSTSQVPSLQKWPNVDLRRYVHHIYDQGKLGSCTANAVCAAYGLRVNLQSQTLNGGYYYFDPSRLFLYYNTREHEAITRNDPGIIQQDSGASVRDTVKALKRQGVSKEVFWPYQVAKFDEKPVVYSYDSAKGNNLCKYERLDQDIDQFRACLKDECPFVFGFNIYKSFLSIGGDGAMPMPTYNELLNEPEGKHAVMAVGYDDRSQRIIVLNSWGSEWGHGGYFYMPYAFLKGSNVCFDFWKISFACEKDKPKPTISPIGRSSNVISAFPAASNSGHGAVAYHGIPTLPSRYGGSSCGSSYGPLW